MKTSLRFTGASMFFLLGVCLFFGINVSAIASVETEFFQNADMSDGMNYSPSGLPSSTSDIVLTTNFQSLTANGNFIAACSLNQLNNSAYTISSGNFGLAAASGGGNSVSPDSNDAIYLGGSASHLTIEARCTFNNSTSNLDIAQAGAILDLTSVAVSAGGTVTKTGAGTLNLSGTWGVSSASFSANGGITNFLSGFSNSAPYHYGLGVNNPNTGAATDVVVNVQTSVEFHGLFGSIAQASSGANTATINLLGETTQLSLESNLFAPPDSSYAGNISGTGSVAIGDVGGGYVQTFSGTNTYTGTTTVNGATLRIDGTTVGQGNYVVSGQIRAAALAGNGTIGLTNNGTITLVGAGSNQSRLDPGTDGTIGTLHVVTSGTGGVIFGNISVFMVDIGAAGSSDLLAIAGGNIDLTSTGDTLSLMSLAGAFDGSVYTIVTFAQNAGNGVFNNIVGLPANYTISYGPTNITISPIPEPSTWAFSVGGLGVVWLLRPRGKFSADRKRRILLRPLA